MKNRSTKKELDNSINLLEEYLKLNKNAVFTLKELEEKFKIKQTTLQLKLKNSVKPVGVKYNGNRACPILYQSILGDKEEINLSYKEGYLTYNEILRKNPEYKKLKIKTKELLEHATPMRRDKNVRYMFNEKEVINYLSKQIAPKATLLQVIASWLKSRSQSIFKVTNIKETNTNTETDIIEF